MREYHILFTGAGRRVELIQAFRQAALQENVKLKIYGADMTNTAPALAYCDYTRIICGMRDKKYIPSLLKICEQDRIDLVIPTIDTDLLILSETVEEFVNIGTKVLISQIDKIVLCRDKNYTADFFESCGVRAPKTINQYENYQGTYPCFIKPKDGSSSINAFVVKKKTELEHYAKKIKDYVIQPFIDGEEYTVDVFCDFEGNPIYIIPRQRLAVRSGEVLKTRIELNSEIIEESKKIIAKFKPCGPMTVQLIRQKETSINYYIEINPRFGGGAPLSMKAGANSAKAILGLLKGKKIEGLNEGIQNHAVYSRFDQSVCVEEGDTGATIKGVIFDLDDTLYSEKQYVKSGYEAVAEFLGSDDAANKLWKYFLSGKPAIDEYLKEENLLNKKNECLKVYREHIPNITLYSGVKELIDELSSKGIKVGIITDGRVQGQKNKIVSLGLDKMIDDIIITDELGGEQFRKPNDIAFRIMQCRWRIPFEQMVYVGDNLEKDFQAPKQLGIRSLYLKNEDGLYLQHGNDENKHIIRKVVEVSNYI